MDCHSGEASNDSLRSAEGARNRKIPKLSGKRTEISYRNVFVMYIRRIRVNGSGPFLCAKLLRDVFHEGSL